MLDSPFPVSVAVATTVQMVGTVVYLQGVLLSVEYEPASRYAVSIPSRNLSGAGTVTDVAFRISVAQNYVTHDSVFVRNYYRNDTGAYGSEYDSRSALVD